MSAPTTPELISNNAINNNSLPIEQNTNQNQQESPFQYRANSPSTSLISDAFPPHPVNVPPIDNDTMTIPLQHNQHQMVANKAGWTTPTKNVVGNGAALMGSNTGEIGGKVTPPRGQICIMTPCSNSHPFEERRILVTRSEENAVKIGRSVVRLQPATNNAIFDCKVLSRNHALLWQTNDGQFVIKDTRSSNGTFINNERLSASGEESGPKELFSGDILQLGVEIVDNTKKVASGCITCIVRLINEQGEEYAARPQGDPFSQLQIRNEQQIPMNYTLVRNDKFFMLEQYIKEAKFRENLLGQKLQILEEQLSGAQDSLKNKWDEHIKQELLLSRIELLESQLGFFTNNKKTSTSNADNSGEDATERLKKEMQELMEDRAKAEQIAKETLRAKLEQIQETSMRLHDAEMSLVNLEEECAFLRQRCADYEDKQREVVPAGHSPTDFQASTSNADNGGEDATERLKKEMQELMEDRARAEQNAKETLRAKLEQIQETSMRLHDAEMSLVNLEEECALLRQRCADYEDKHREVVPVGHSPTDFQVFILSTLPFLLIIMVIFSPAFYFFGPTSTTAPTNMDETPIDSRDKNLLELDEAKEDKKENDH